MERAVLYAVWGPEQSHKSRVDGDYITHLSDTIVAALPLTVNACVTAMQAACGTDRPTRAFALQ